MDNQNPLKEQKNNEIKSNLSSLRWLSKLNSQINAKRRNTKIFNNLDGLGEIELAIMHREANRPLRKIKEFNKNTKFCPCCSLPVEQKGYIERFSFCDNTDMFSECGRGISLYFSYFRFSIIILLLAFVTMGIPTFYFTYDYTKQLRHACHEIYDLEKAKINETFPECSNLLYLEIINGISIYDSYWKISLNSYVSKKYKLLHYNLINSYGNVNQVVINFTFIFFICLIFLFVINLIYNIYLFNLNKKYDLLVTSPSDFAVMVYNLHLSFNILYNKINIINSEINNKNSSCSEGLKINDEEHQNNENNIKKQLGLEDFPDNTEINIGEAFHSFIKNKICKSSNEDENYKINYINICYKINEYMEIERKIQEKKKQILLVNFDPKQQLKNKDLIFSEKKYYYSPFNLFGINLFNCKLFEKSILLSEIQEEKGKLEKNLEELLKETENLTESNFAGVIFIVFETMDEQEKFLKKFSKNFFMNLLYKLQFLIYIFIKCCISEERRTQFLLKRDLEINVAPEPEVIFFENLQYSSLEKKLRVVMTSFLSLIIIGICFFIILLLNNLQIKYMEKSILIKYCFSCIISVVISMINEILEIFLGHLVKMEKLTTKTNYYLSLSLKLTIFTFITSAIVPFITDYYNNFDKDYDLLVTNITICFITNSILTPLIWVFNFKYLFKKTKICLLERKEKHNLTQRELNYLYELPDMQISYKYSYLVKTVLMTFFYLPLFPLGTIISSLGLFFGYYLEKWNFSKMYKRPEMINCKIVEFYSYHFPLNFFMLGLGDHIFMSDDTNYIWHTCFFIIFGIIAIVPFNKIFNYDFLGINESQIKKEKYDDIFFTFYNDYDRSNPMTKKEGITRFVNKLKDKEFIKDTEYEEILKNLENINLMEVYYDSQKDSLKDSIKRSYTIQSSIVKTNDNYKFNVNKFIKENKEYILNILLSLGKKRQGLEYNNTNMTIIDKNDTTRDNNVNKKITKITNTHGKSDVDCNNNYIYNKNTQNLETINNINNANAHKKREQKENREKKEIYTPTKNKEEFDRYANKNSLNYNKSNIIDTDNYEKVFRINKRMYKNKNKNKLINRYIMDNNAKDTFINSNIDSRNNINNDNYNINNNINDNIINNGDNNVDEFYGGYQKMNYQKRKNYKLKIYSKDNIPEDNNKKINRINKRMININNKNIRNEKMKFFKINKNNEQNLPSFSINYFEDLQQKVLNQYKKI